MDYEKKYKDALERARQVRTTNVDENKKSTEYIFPELKESEDSRMKKSLKRLIAAFYDCNFPTPEGFTREELFAWLEKQGKKKEYTFKSIPRLLDMLEPTSRAKDYCKKLIDTLEKEGYTTDAEIVRECLKKMNGEEVPIAIMDETQGEKPQGKTALEAIKEKPIDNANKAE